mmetsp:Transcript_15662/g.31506  ORF Transcript_15662/g.31506 Transcript_15662/m.31506 type:complete len:245 (-) Transcript_15662:307-1041(-)
MTRSNISCICAVVPPSTMWSRSPPCSRSHLSICLRSLGYSVMFLRAPTQSRTVGKSEFGSKRSSSSGSAHGLDWYLPSLLIVIAMMQPEARRRTFGEPWRTCCARISSSPASIAASLPLGVLARFHRACNPVSSRFATRCFGSMRVASRLTTPLSSASSMPRSSRTRLERAPSADVRTSRDASSSAPVSLLTSPSVRIISEQPSRLDDSESSAEAHAARTVTTLSLSPMRSAGTVLAVAAASLP